MANFLNFDGVGVVTFPDAVAPGAFTVEFTSLLITNGHSNEIFLADNNTASDFYATQDSGNLNYRTGGNGTAKPFNPSDIGTLVNFKIVRNAANAVSFFVNDVQIGSSDTRSGTVTLNVFSGYNFGNLKYFGEMHGQVIMTGFNGGDRIYDIAGATGSTIVDTVSGQNATLSGFTTGGLQPDVGVDTTPPVITLLGSTPINVVQNESYVDAGATATDDVDGDITANIITVNNVNTSIVGGYTVTYNVSDAAGNAATEVVRTVNVIAAADVTPPTITLLGSNPLSVVQGSSYVEPGYTANDDVEGDITANVVVTGSVDTNILGQYLLNYDVADSSGNNATTQTRTVNVVAAGTVVNVTSPTDYQCKQRDNSGNAIFDLIGDFGTAQLFEYSLDGGLTFTQINGTASTSFNIQIVVNGQKDLIVRVVNDVTTETTVSKVTSAMCICGGPSQSNGSGRGINLQPVTLNQGAPVPIRYTSAGFEVLADPTNEESYNSGSVWAGVCSYLANKGIPVCFRNPAIGGTSVLAWQPGSAGHNKIIQFGDAVGGIEKLVTIIGETDSQIGTSKADYKTNYLNAVNPIISTYGATVYAVKFPVGQGLFYKQPETAAIKQAIEELIAENANIKFGGDLSVIDIDTETGSDGTHLKTDNQINQAVPFISRALYEVSFIEMNLTGIPDGVINTRVYNSDAYFITLSGQLFWSAGLSQQELFVPVGTNIEYYALDATNAGVNVGVTVQ